MPTTITAHEQPVSRIFSNDYVFRIPTYQRPYAWTGDQALELFDDLTSYMRARPGPIEDMPPYFWVASFSSRKRKLQKPMSSMANKD